MRASGVRPLVALGTIFAFLLTSGGPRSLAWPAEAPGARAGKQLPRVIVSARRIPGLSLEESKFPGHVTVLTGEEIERSGARTAADAIAYAEGTVVTDQQGFGLGSDSTVNLRGVVNSSRTNALVLVNGVRQNRITGDDVHWQSIPVDQIDRIEILRGGGGTMFGEGALSGVINILTATPSERPFETEETVELGSFGWQRYHTEARGRLSPMRYNVGFTRRLTDGYRESSQSRNSTLTVDTGVDLGEALTADLHVLHSEDTTGFPGLITQAQAEARRIQPNAFRGVNKNEIDQVSLDLRGGPWDGVTAYANAYWRRWVQQSEDTTPFNAFTVTPSRGLTLRGNAEWEGGALGNLLIGGVELSEDQATTGSTGIYAGADSESNKTGYGLFLEDTVTAWDRVSLSGGVRFDKSRFEESLVFPAFNGTLRFEGWSPKLGLSVVAIPDALTVFTSYARPFKAPNVDDFSSRLGSSFTGNADLDPQQADSYEVGARVTHAQAEAHATAFYTRIDDEILFNQLTFTNQNFDTRRVGLELSGQVEPVKDRVRLHATYTFVDAEFTRPPFNEHTVPGTPEHTFTSRLGVSPLDGLWLEAQWLLVHDYVRVNDLNNALQGADNYGVLNLHGRYTLPRTAEARAWMPEMTAFIRVDNVTNEEYTAYQSSNGSNMSGAGEAPAPPTSVFGGVTVSF